MKLGDGALIETVLLPAVSGPGLVAELDADAVAVRPNEDESGGPSEVTPFGHEGRVAGTNGSRNA